MPVACQPRRLADPADAVAEPRARLEAGDEGGHHVPALGAGLLPHGQRGGPDGRGEMRRRADMGVVIVEAVGEGAVYERRPGRAGRAAERDARPAFGPPALDDAAHRPAAGFAERAERDAQRVEQAGPGRFHDLGRPVPAGGRRRP